MVSRPSELGSQQTRPRRVLLVGTGDLGTKVAMLMAHSSTGASFRVLGRNQEKALRLANMARLSAKQCNKSVQVDSVGADLFELDQTAAAIADFDPDVIFTSASTQAWHGITQLSPPVHARVAAAGYGPWLAMHLAPTYGLMRAVRECGVAPFVVNAAFPDAVHPVLKASGMAPHAGIGNVANYVPGLETLVSQDMGVPMSSVRVRFIAHHFVSFSVSRRGETRGAPYILDVEVGGRSANDHVDPADLFHRLSVQQPRTSGKEGQFMTAASAVSVLEPLVTGATVHTHSPGFGGRVGGWPVAIDGGRMALDLPDHLTEAQAEEVNLAGQVWDGIDSIGEDGTVAFTDTAISVMNDELGYDPQGLRPDTAWQSATELRAKFLELLDRDRAGVLS